MKSIIPEYLPLDRPLVIFDLETTGLGIGEDKMVEIAYEKIYPNGDIVAKVQRINPGMLIPAEATRINKITDEDVKDCPSFASLSFELWSVFDGADVGGFNVIGFDLPFLRAEFSTVGKNFDFNTKRILDGKVLYHKVAPRDMVSARNLSAAYKLFCGDTHTTAHTAAGDVRVTVQVIEKELEKYPEFRDWKTIAELHGRKELLESVKNEHAPLVGSGKIASLF